MRSLKDPAAAAAAAPAAAQGAGAFGAKVDFLGNHDFRGPVGDHAECPKRRKKPEIEMVLIYIQGLFSTPLWSRAVSDPRGTNIIGTNFYAAETCGSQPGTR